MTPPRDWHWRDHQPALDRYREVREAEAAMRAAIAALKGAR